MCPADEDDLAMARYRKIDVSMWGDKKFRSLSKPAPNARDCWIHLLTNRETTNIPGVFRAYEEALARDLEWPADGYRTAFSEIAAKGMAEADWDSGLVFVPNVIKYNPPDSPNVIRGWKVAWQELPDCPLKDKVFQHLSTHIEGMGKGFREAFAEVFREGYRQGSPNQEQEQEQEQEIRDKGGYRDSSTPQVPQGALPAGGFALEPPEQQGGAKRAGNNGQQAINAQAVALLADLNAARKRVIPGARDLRPIEPNLKGIRDRLKEGVTAEEVRIVIATYERESKGNAESAKWFDAVTPFRPANFARALAKTPTPPPRGGGAAGHAVPQRFERLDGPQEPSRPRPPMAPATEAEWLAEEQERRQRATRDYERLQRQQRGAS